MLSRINDRPKPHQRWWGRVVLVCALSALPAAGQINKQPQAPAMPGQVNRQPQAPATATPSEKAVSGDYVLGPGDVLTIMIADSPELSGKYRVGNDGRLSIPQVPTPIEAKGLTSAQLSKKIGDALKAAELLKDPVVNVFVEEYHSRYVTVVGAVAKPAVYPLDRPTTLLETLSLAGGLTPQAGNQLTLTHSSRSSENPATSAGQSSRTIDLAKLMQGKDPSLNIEVRPGDVIHVSQAPIVYVVGAVSKPGGFVVQNPESGMTVLQALAMAEGLQPAAARNRTVLIHRSAEGKERQEVPIDLGKLMAGKTRDQYLQPNDILFVPESGTKKTLQAMGRTAEQAVVGIATYGAGLRLGR
jgi:polysaccharide export outer membrane protein